MILYEVIIYYESRRNAARARQDVTGVTSGLADSMMLAKLTKKQKKSLTFRKRATGKRHSRNELIEMDNTAFPAMEDQDIASLDCDTLEVEKKCKKGDEAVRDQDKQGVERKCKKGDETIRDQDKQGVESKGKGRAKEKDVSVEVVKTTKRKRACEDGAQTSEFQSRKVSKRKKDNDVTQSSETKKTAVKQRFILFVGSHLFYVFFHELANIQSQAISSIRQLEKPFKLTLQSAVYITASLPQINRL